MHTDARTLEDGALIEADLCIVGAGAAGISMALDRAGSAERVVLLEGGGFEVSPKLQQLYENFSSGRSYYPLESARLHYFGGTTNHWGGQCAPMDSIDFERRSWVPRSGWPIDREELDSYYERAGEIVNLAAPAHWRPAFWENRRAGAALPLDEARMRTKMWQWSNGVKPALRFGPAYRSEIVASENVALFTHANVCHVGAAEGGHRIEELTVRHFDGAEQTVRASEFVLACGAVQNTRLLLASNDVVDRGIGNQNDLVGRHFMEHVEVDTARLALPESRSLPFYRWEAEEGEPLAYGLLQPSPSMQRSRELLNGALRLRLKPRSAESPYTFDDFPEDARKTIAVWEKRANALDTTVTDRSYSSHERYQLNIRMEQTPDPHSRITLSEERDALGVPKVDLHWTLSERDRRSVRRITELAGEELARIGLGRVRLMDWLRGDEGTWPGFLTGGWHHMGTLRMAENPEDGVVNEHGRVHGVENLHVAGSAVFPTGSCVNPTLTLVALTLRLSDRLS